ncbi:MAG: hypothetical protein ACK5LU_09950 [Pseudanabaena sp.]
MDLIAQATVKTGGDSGIEPLKPESEQEKESQRQLSQRYLH